ncbi:MAG: hypothetical protein GX821_13070 [Clostridiaceae bacterium]|nr:hypothetical protein [Clostridiaceae bacterium]
MQGIRQAPQKTSSARERRGLQLPQLLDHRYQLHHQIGQNRIGLLYAATDENGRGAVLLEYFPVDFCYRDPMTQDIFVYTAFQKVFNTGLSILRHEVADRQNNDLPEYLAISGSFWQHQTEYVVISNQDTMPLTEVSLDARMLMNFIDLVCQLQEQDIYPFILEPATVWQHPDGQIALLGFDRLQMALLAAFPDYDRIGSQYLAPELLGFSYAIGSWTTVYTLGIWLKTCRTELPKNIILRAIEPLPSNRIGDAATLRTLLREPHLLRSFKQHTKFRPSDWIRWLLLIMSFGILATIMILILL